MAKKPNTHTHDENMQSTHTTHNCILLMQNTHGHPVALPAGWAGLCADRLDEIWGLMDIYISLCFYSDRRIIYHPLGDTETYVNPYPLTNMIQSHFKSADQIVITSNTSFKKTHKHSTTFRDRVAQAGLKSSSSFWLCQMTNRKWTEHWLSNAMDAMDFY